MEDEQTEQKEKMKKGINGKTVFILTIIVTILFFFSPLPKLIISTIPEDYVRKAFAPLLQIIILTDQKHTLDQPRKYAHENPLPILSHNSGICFSFQATLKQPNEDIIETSILDDAAKGRTMAEIIAIGINDETAKFKKEYPLKDIEIHEEIDANGKKVSKVCQIFGNHVSTLPQAIQAIYVRPYAPITPYEVTWYTIADF